MNGQLAHFLNRLYDGSQILRIQGGNSVIAYDLDLTRHSSAQSSALLQHLQCQHITAREYAVQLRTLLKKTADQLLVIFILESVQIGLPYSVRNILPFDLLQEGVMPLLGQQIKAQIPAKIGDAAAFFAQQQPGGQHSP